MNKVLENQPVIVDGKVDAWKSYRAVGRMLANVGVKEERILTRKELERRIAAGESFEDIAREQFPQVFNAQLPGRSALADAIDPKRQAMRDAAAWCVGD